MTLPGFREFYPEDYRLRAFLQRIWRDVAHAHAFEEYESPVLEPLDLYLNKVGSELTDQLFHFVDKGDRAVALRPEMTASTARMVGARANALSKPIKWFNVGDQFRFERPQKGRLRCFTQFNVDLFGEAGPEGEAEVLGLLAAVLDRFQLGPDVVVIRLSDRILWTAFLESLGFAGEAARAVLQVVDRSAKMKPEARREALAVAAPERDPDELWSELGQFMELRGFTELESFAAASGNFGLTARLADWKILLEALEARGIGDYIKVDLSIVRGIAYYTGFVFEVFPASGQGRALAGGGRYDHLVEKVAGVSLPAVGFGMGDVTLADLLAELGRLPPIVGEGEIWMAALGSEERKVMLADATRLRRIGLKVDYSLQAASNLGKQLKEADRKKARIALIYGKDELDQGKVQVKFLASRATHEVPRASLIEFLRYGPDDSSGPAE